MTECLIQCPSFLIVPSCHNPFSPREQYTPSNSHFVPESGKLALLSKLRRGPCKVDGNWEERVTWEMRFPSVENPLLDRSRN